MGIKHAPGVLCWVVGATKFPENLGKVVTIAKRRPDLDQWFTGGVAWEVDCQEPLACWTTPSTRTKVFMRSAVVPQNKLLPFADPSQNAGERDETKKPETVA